jgi:hypothetical protein
MSAAARVMRNWRTLAPERRLAAGASLGLFVTLFLPWYQETVVAAGRTNSATLTGWAAFSFVEAAVLLVAAAVVTLLLQRAEGRAFHLPGGDGWVITLAGAWTCVLVVWRILDKQSAQVSGPGAAASGVEWGIFMALGLAGLLTYAGSRIRRAGAPEPPLPDGDELDFSLPRRGRGSQGEGSRRRAERRVPASEPDTRAARASPPERRRSSSRTETIAFPVPEPLADPPTLRIGRTDRAATERTRPEPAPRALRPPDPEEQLTMPFDSEEP